MRTLSFTYDVYVYEGNQKVYGESCIDITMADDFAERFLYDTAFRGEIVLVENIIKANEFLKDRNYVTAASNALRNISNKSCPAQIEKSSCAGYN